MYIGNDNNSWHNHNVRGTFPCDFLLLLLHLLVSRLTGDVRTRWSRDSGTVVFRRPVVCVVLYYSYRVDIKGDSSSSTSNCSYNVSWRSAVAAPVAVEAIASAAADDLHANQLTTRLLPLLLLWPCLSHWLVRPVSTNVRCLSGSSKRQGRWVLTYVVRRTTDRSKVKLQRKVSENDKYYP